MFDLSFLSQSMWDIYSLCSSAGKPGFNRSAELDSLAGLNFMDLMRNVDGSTKYAVSDPKKQLMDDYYAWKAQQPQLYLPDSKGDTEENRAFLRRNFSGQLSIMERIYALDTMREMGMITEEEMRETIGVNEFNISIINLRDVQPIALAGPIGLDPAISKWNDFFLDANISRCPTLDKMYQMIGAVQKSLQQRKAHREEQSAAQEVEQALSQLTARKIS